MKAEVRYPFIEEIKKRSLKALIAIIAISFIIGWFFGGTLAVFCFFMRIIFPIDSISIIFYIIIGMLLVLLEITRYKKYKILGWMPFYVLTDAFIAGITLPMLFATITIENIGTFIRFFDILALFMYWNFGKAILDGLVEMKKIKLKTKIQNIINIVSWVFYFVLVFLKQS